MLTASCLCSSVRLEIAELPDSVTECNCSVCRRYGARWAYYRRRAVRVTAEHERLHAYQRHGGLEFVHCAVCGCILYHEPALKRGDDWQVGVNMRVLDDPAALVGLKLVRLDGAHDWDAVDGPLLEAGW